MGSNKRLRVAFFALLPTDNMASWTFCQWPVDHSGQLGIEGRLFAPSSPRLHASLTRRGSLGWRLRAALYWYVIVLIRRLGQIALILRYDVVFIQRGVLRAKSVPFLERLIGLLSRAPIVYHLDDALWVLRPRNFEVRCQLADRVVTGNEAVTDFARRAGAEVTTVEYPVEVQRYEVRQHRDRSPVMIGYTGTAPEEYLEPALNGLLSVCESADAKFMVVGGSHRPSVGPLEPYMEWQPWRPEQKFSALRHFDIGILPMEDSELNRGKEPLKLKEYLAYGLPVVASPVGHNLAVMEHGAHGFFAGNDDEWATFLERLVRSPALRSKLGANGRRLVEDRYDFSLQMKRLLDVFHEVCAGVHRSALAS
jgi:glycosyltransferase involved in cell wall biosynthesis